MFTLSQIEIANQKVKTGADFPNYIQNLKKIGVLSFETYVIDSHSIYYGTNGYMISSDAVYPTLSISSLTDKSTFIQQLKSHQAGLTAYYQFCLDCAEAGIEKWIMDLQAMTCSYYNIQKELVLVEQIPSLP